jgi:hypothetical protein
VPETLADAFLKAVQDYTENLPQAEAFKAIYMAG